MSTWNLRSRAATVNRSFAFTIPWPIPENSALRSAAITSVGSGSSSMLPMEMLPMVVRSPMWLPTDSLRASLTGSIRTGGRSSAARGAPCGG